ncbi:MAG: hypothetical protein EBT43_04140 [Methylocystaceae bacterium]|nr:hypothetical protein [Methylocystaceae bacterium]
MCVKSGLHKCACGGEAQILFTKNRSLTGRPQALDGIRSSEQISELRSSMTLNWTNVNIGVLHDPALKLKA